MKKLIEKTTQTEFQVPEDWGEVTLGQYYEIQENKGDFVGIVSLLTGIQKEELEKWEEKFINIMLLEFAWLSKPIKSAKWVNVHEIDIMGESLGQLFLFEGIQGKPKFIYEAIKIYFVALQPRDMVLREAIPLVKDLQKQMAAYIKIEQEQLHSEPTAEQKRAGIGKFSRFGRMNTVDALAGGDITKYDEVYKIDVKTALIKQMQMKVEAVYERNYSKIMHEK